VLLTGSALAGVLAGMVVYVAAISEGASYLSDDPRACVNCHVMVPQLATWRHSSHGRDTTCNDCHVPHSSVLAKYAFKASDGLRHSALFTLRRERQVIQAIPASRAVIQANCIRCHLPAINDVSPDHSFERSCIDCHREVPHGRVHSLSATPNAAVPPLSPVLPGFLAGGERE
jgi:cytochrome c nitrite reductase small subunit